MTDYKTQVLVRRVIVTVSLGVLLVLSWHVLNPFIVPAVWAMILSYVTWPLYRLLQRVLGRLPNLCALSMTLLLVSAGVLPFIGLFVSLQGEAANAYHRIVEELSHGPLRLPGWIAEIPWLGDQLQAFVSRITRDSETLRSEVSQWIAPSEIAGSVTRNALKFAFAVVTVFFFYRDGKRLSTQLRMALERGLGARAHRYLQAAAVTTKAVVYGIVLTALAQGVLAGLGYWGAGVDAPVLLGAVTALVALMPFGTPLVWGAIAASLLMTGKTVAGVGLLLWGTFVVSWVDNVIRPLVISSATKIPFLLVMFGVIGGLAAFGMIGLFVGPVILAVLMAVWQEWLEEQQIRPPEEPPAA